MVKGKAPARTFYYTFKLQSDGIIEIIAGQDIKLQDGTQVDAEGDIKLQAGGDLIMTAAANQNSNQNSSFGANIVFV